MHQSSLALSFQSWNLWPPVKRIPGRLVAKTCRCVALCVSYFQGRLAGSLIILKLFSRQGLIPFHGFQSLHGSVAFGFPGNGTRSYDDISRQAWLSFESTLLFPCCPRLLRAWYTWGTIGRHLAFITAVSAPFTSIVS